MRNDFESNYLAHFGIKDMKWYQRRFQNPDGTLTEEGRRRYGIGPAREKGKETEKGQKKEGLITSLKQKSAEKKKAKQQKANLEKARAARAQKAAEKRQAEQREAEEKRKAEEFAKEKERILRSGDPKQILEYKDNLTDQEIQSALNRIRNEQDIKSYVKQSEKSGFDKINSFMGKAEKAYNWAQTGIKWYNVTASLYNTFLSDGPEYNWKKINMSIGNKKDKNKK